MITAPSRLRVALLTLLALPALAPAAGAILAPPDLPPCAPTALVPAECVTFRRIEQGSWSYAREGAYVIDTAEEWQAFWAAHTGGRRPVPPAPVVDFGLEWVAAVVGYHPYCCPDLEVVRVVRHAPNTFHVVYEQEREGHAAALTWPYDIVAVPRDSAAPVTATFEEREAPLRDITRL